MLPFDLPDELNDIQEQADTVGFLTPREYARLRNMAPQMVYYYIRNKVIETDYCRCGRRVLNVQEADNRIQAQKEARSSKLDTGDASPTLD